MQPKQNKKQSTAQTKEYSESWSELWEIKILDIFGSVNNFIFKSRALYKDMNSTSMFVLPVPTQTTASKVLKESILLMCRFLLIYTSKKF